MKVAIVTPVYPPYRGGMGAVAARDARELRARGLEVAVLTPDYSGREHNVEATYVKPLLTSGNAAVLPRLLGALKGFDIAHLHYTFYGADVFVWLWSKLKRRPFVMTYHMQPTTNDWRNIVFTLHRWLIQPWLVRDAKAVLISSQDYAESLGLHHKHLVELPFGVDERRFSPGDGDVVRAAYNLPLEAQVFIFVGGLDRAHSFKGVDVLLRAAACLPLDKVWRVLIVGDGDMRSSYEALAATLGLRDRVVFVGAVSDIALPDLYRASNVHILPSVSKSEAFGLVTLEAAATGLPSIVTNLPGVRTLVVPGATGFVVEPGNDESLEAALQTCLESPEQVSAMGTRARARVLEKYTQTKVADRLVAVYKTLVA